MSQSQPPEDTQYCVFLLAHMINCTTNEMATSQGPPWFLRAKERVDPRIDPVVQTVDPVDPVVQTIT